MKPKKALGQNFLICSWVSPALISAADLKAEDTVVEVGPGKGVLTIPLARSVKQLIAIEKDEQLAADLGKTLVKESIKNVKILTGDVIDAYPQLAKELPEKFIVVGNIPYYLTSHLLRILLENPKMPERIVFTVQKEVAVRICAKPSRMSMLAISVQAYGTPAIVVHVPATCFNPKPKVDSAIIAISDISKKFFEKNKISETEFFSFVRKGFLQKRKTLLNNLRPLGDREKTENLLTKCKIDAKARAETLSIEQWVTLARSVKD